MYEDSILNRKVKKAHVQGENWTIVARYNEFDVADQKRQSVISPVLNAKVQRMSDDTFLVKTRKVAVVAELKDDVAESKEVETKTANTSKKSNPKREERAESEKRANRKNK